MYLQTQGAQLFEARGKSHLKENPSDLHLERNHTQVDLHQNLAGHDLATHQLRKEP